MPISPTPPSSVPDFPAMGDASFNQKAYDWAQHMATSYPADMTALADTTYDNAVDAADSATAANSSKVAAAASAVTAQDAATAAVQTAGAAKWVSGTTYAQGACVWSPADAQTYRRKVAGGGTTDPSQDSANWSLLTAGASAGINPSPVIVEFEQTVTMANTAAYAASSYSVFNLDASREFINFGNGHCAVYNRTTKTLGAIASYRASTNNATAVVVVNANTVIVVSCTVSGTAFEAVGITISGVTCTVGTPATATLAGNMSGGFGNFIMVGSTAVISYGRATTTKALRAMTISGNTVTLGAEVTLTGAATGTTILEAHTSSVLLAFHQVVATTYCSPYTVSGTTLTLGTEASTTLTSGNNLVRLGGKLASGRYFIGSALATLIGLATISGTTASWATVSTTTAVVTTSLFIHKSGDQVLFAAEGGGVVSGNFFVLTDNAGSPLFTATGLSLSSGGIYPVATGFAQIAAVIDGRKRSIAISGNTAAITLSSSAIPPSTVKPPALGAVDQYGRPSGNLYGLINGSKVASLANDISSSSNTRSFSYHTDGTSEYIVTPPVNPQVYGNSASNNYQAAWGSSYTSTAATSVTLIRIALP